MDDRLSAAAAETQGDAVESTPGLSLGDLSYVPRDLARILVLAAIMLALLAAATVALG